MGWFEQETRLKPLVERQDELEARAGISQVMEQAREADFACRQRTRSAYFSVEDIELRKCLVAQHRAVDAEIERAWQEDMRDATQKVLDAKAAVQREPWGAAALVAVGCVGFGYHVFALPGAIAGAVGGSFIAVGVVSSARRRAKSELEQAEAGLQQLKTDQELRSSDPEIFNWREEQTGESAEVLAGSVKSSAGRR